MRVALAFFANDAKSAAPTTFSEVRCAETVCAIIGPGVISIEEPHRIFKNAPPARNVQTEEHPR